jgi:hypothetical protein
MHHLRIADHPLSTSLRDLRRTNLNNQIRFSGISRGVFPLLESRGHCVGCCLFFEHFQEFGAVKGRQDWRHW